MSQYKSVSDMIQDMDLDDATTKELLETLEARSIMRQLVAIRVATGGSLQAIADAIKVPLEEVEQIEGKKDNYLSMSEIKLWAEALGCEVRIVKKETRDEC